jgi:hypothetical protein
MQRCAASTSSDLAAVDVQDFAGDERRALEIQDPIDHIADLRRRV